MSKQENPNVVGNIAIVFMSLLLIAIGCIMLFTDAVRMVYFCYGAGACLLVWGIWMISRYFLHKEFQRTTNYGFSVGTLVVILGAVDLIRAQEIADSIPNYLGILVLIEGVVMLQNTVQLKNLKGNLWTVSLIFSLCSVAGAVVILLNLGNMITKYVSVFYLMLVIVGVFALLSLCFVGIRTKHYHKETQRELERNMEESAQWFAAKEKATSEQVETENVTESIEENIVGESSQKEDDEQVSSLVEEEV